MRAEPVRTSIALVLFVLGIIGTADAAARKRLVVFAFDQTIDAVIRIEDLNGDGDTLDAREVTRFIDDTIAPSLGVENAQGIVAISRWEVFATDNGLLTPTLKLKRRNVLAKYEAQLDAAS